MLLKLFPRNETLFQVAISACDAINSSPLATDSRICFYYLNINNFNLSVEKFSNFLLGLHLEYS